MRIVIQRVKHASVTIDQQIYNQINEGLLLLVGFCDSDDESILPKMVDKVAGIRIFEDEQGKLNLSAMDLGLEVLSISQFTLYGDMKKGKRPSFDHALNPQQAKALYESFNQLLSAHLPVKTGVFQADMKVELLNDGPVTIILDSDELIKKVK
ncbi:MAG: D-aminoacyl-tRNA deacylase [Erysipelotrichaceae bacterium]|nr:D-aminoacyl-tRNA deacylase [Erysipelotrichaceae bacterium]